MVARVRGTVTVLSCVCLTLVAGYVDVPSDTNSPKTGQHAQVSTSSAGKLFLYHFLQFHLNDHININMYSQWLAKIRRRYVNIYGSYF